MAYDFPPSPFTGQVYAGWTYDGEKWLSTTATPNTAGVIAIQVFTQSGIYVPTASMTSCVIECVGGGGGGGGIGAPAAGQAAGAGGGGGGGYARKLATAAVIGASQNVSVGVAGAAGAAGATLGGNGGVSSVGSLASAGGGIGGSAGTPFGVGQSYVSGGGGIGTIGDVFATGGVGTTGCQSVVTAATGGSGGSSALSGGANGTTTLATAAGINCTGYGGGGGGACAVQSQAAQAGGKGAPGLVIVTEYGMTALASTAGQGNVRYDLPQGLSLNQKAQARANIDSLKKNYIINGAMQISQEWGNTALANSGVYPVDQFTTGVAGTTAAWLFAQVASSTPSGSPNRIRLTVTTADAAVATGDVFSIYQVLEGLRAVDLRPGSAAAKTVTLQFGCKAPAGTYCVAIRNSPANRSYIAEYTIAVGEANTDVIKSVTVLLDQTGTWAADNTAGIVIQWALMAGATFQTPANIWTAGSFIGSSNQFNFFATNGNVFELFDVGLYEGTVAPAFQVPDYANELVLCQRYFQLYNNLVFSGYNSATGGCYGTLLFPTMRAAPTATPSTIGYSNSSTLALNLITINSFRHNLTITATGLGYVTYNVVLSTRL